MNVKEESLKRLKIQWLGIFLLAMLTTLVPAIAVSDAAGSLKPADLVELKQMGFTEESIRQEVIDTTSVYELNDEDLATLQQAGFSTEFIEFLQALKPGLFLDNEAVGGMLARDMTLESILGEIARHRRDFDASPLALLHFKKRFDAPKWLLRVMRGESLDLEEIKGMGQDNLTVQEQLLLIDILGTDTAFSDAQMLQLLHAGVPGDVVRQLRQVARSPDADNDLPRSDYYPHPLGLFTLRYPPDWRLIKDMEGDLVTYILTPEQGVTSLEDLNIGLMVMVSPMDPESAMADLTPVQTLERILPMVLQSEPGLSPASETRTTRLGALPAAQLSLSGTVSDKQGNYTGNLTLAFKDGLMALLLSLSPEDQLAVYSSAFAGILEKSTFLSSKEAPRRATAIATQDLVEKYRAGVVSVLSYRDNEPLGSGTGFIIREDGYLLTNHHVVWDREKNRPATRFMVDWDSDIDLAQTEASLVGCRKTNTYQAQLFPGLSSGVDIALLKLESDGPYTALPLVGTKEIQLADPVLTMGFPARGMIQTLSTVVTSGIVTRLNKDFTGKLESIFVDAPIAHGSSGGPALNLMLGRVFGQNTFGSFGIANVHDLWNYFGVIPIDYALTEYPVETLVSRTRDQRLEAAELYDLALNSRSRGATGGALALAARALRADPESPDTNYLLGRMTLEQALTEADLEKGVKHLTQALAADPDHLPTLIYMALAYVELGDLKKAQDFADRAVNAHPGDLDAYDTRVRVHIAARHFTRALADLEVAKRLTQKAIPTAYLLAGETYYAMKHFGEGRKEFEEAVRIHPANLEARLGIARYYDLTEQPVAALLEYNRIQRDMPGNPAVLSELGRSYQAIGKPDKALESYFSALDRSQKLGMRPLAEIYMGGAHAALTEKVNKPGVALNLYLGLLVNYWGEDAAFDAHIAIARLFSDNKDTRAIARGHLLWALDLRKDDQAARTMSGQLANARLSLEAIQSMVNEMGYPPAIAGLVIRETPLDFEIEVSQKSMDELQKILPGEVAMGILMSAEKHQVDKKAVNADAGQVTEPSGNALLGTWSSALRDENTGNYAGEVIITFDANGFYQVTVQTGEETGTERGSYQLAGNTLLLKSETGESSRYQYQLRAGQLLLTDSDGSELVLSRNG